MPVLLNPEPETWALFSVMQLVFNYKLTSPGVKAAIFQANLLLHCFQLLPARYSKETKRKTVFGTSVCLFLAFRNFLNFY